MGTTRNILRYDLDVRGVFGRNRKAKLEIFHLPGLQDVAPETPASPADLENAAQLMLAHIGAQHGLRWEVHEWADLVVQPDDGRHPPAGIVVMTRNRVRLQGVVDCTETVQP